MTDPINVLTMPLGGGEATIARRILTQGLISAGTKAAEVSLIAVERGTRGEKLTVGEAATYVAVGGVAGATLQGVVVEPIAALARRARARLGASATPVESAAVHTIEREAEVEAASPFRLGADGEQHAARLDRATATLNGDEPAAAIAPRPRSNLSQTDILRFVLNDLEGGAKVVHFSDADGGATKFGIAAKWNRGVDVANLDEAGAMAIARAKHWFPAFDAADPRTAAVAFDAAYISGPTAFGRLPWT